MRNNKSCWDFASKIKYYYTWHFHPEKVIQQFNDKERDYDRTISNQKNAIVDLNDEIDNLLMVIDEKDAEIKKLKEKIKTLRKEKNNE